MLIAAVFLAVIGGSVGLTLGLRDRDRDTTGAAAQTTQQPVPAWSASPQGRSPAVVEPSQPPATPTPAEVGAPGGASGACPDAIRRYAGRTDLVQVHYLQTNLSEVWICRDSGGGLYFQGHRGGPEDRPIQASGQDWLFLTDVKQKDEAGNVYVAVNGAWTYVVSPELLKIIGADGKTETQPAITPSG